MGVNLGGIINSGSPQGADPVQQHTLVSAKEGH